MPWRSSAGSRTTAGSGGASKSANVKWSSDVWLQKHLADPEVKQTSTGLQYKVLRTTQNCFPDPKYPVTVHYQAALARENMIIDSSYDRGKPSTYSLNKMVPAWIEGIPMMREGEQWEFYAPPKLAYGAKGSPPLIGPDSVLVFRIELIKADRCRP